MPVMIVIRYGVRKRGWTRREPQREQVIPAHGEGNPALAEDQDHHDHREPDEDRERDDQLRSREGRVWRAVAAGAAVASSL